MRPNLHSQDRRRTIHHAQVFRNLQVARSINEFGWGTWEVAARFSSADFSDGEINGGELELYSLRVNWWLTSAFSFGVNIGTASSTGSAWRVKTAALQDARP
jgi:hypothetical protein